MIEFCDGIMAKRSITDSENKTIAILMGQITSEIYSVTRCGNCLIERLVAIKRYAKNLPAY